MSLTSSGQSGVTSPFVGDVEPKLTGFAVGVAVRGFAVGVKVGGVNDGFIVGDRLGEMLLVGVSVGSELG